MLETILQDPDYVAVDGAEAAGNHIKPDTFFLKDVSVETAEKRRPAERLYHLSHAPGEPGAAALALPGPASGPGARRCVGTGLCRPGMEEHHPWQTLPWYALVNDGDRTAGYGVMVRCGAICGWQIDPEGITLCLDIRNGGEGVLLNGRTLEAAAVVSEIYEGMSAFAAARAFCGRLCVDPVLPDRPVYGSNNWYYACGRSSREDILADAEYLAGLTEGVENRPYMVIDDGWQKGRYNVEGAFEKIYNGGPWIPNTRFGDMGTLAEEIRRKNVIPGIWVRLLQDELSGLPAEWKLPGGGLDPSVPGVLNLVRETVRRIGSWGYRLLMHDFSTFDMVGRWGSEMNGEMAEDGWHFADRTRTTAEIIVGLYQEIFDAAKPFGMLVLGCNTVGHLGAGLPANASASCAWQNASG